MTKTSKSTISKILMAGCAVAALSACGADDIASPGSGGDITINNPPAETPEPTEPTNPGTVTAAEECPNVGITLTDNGTIYGPTGTWRVCTLPAKISANTTLPKVTGLVYELSGRVDVGDDLGATPVSGENGVTLTIQPGTILFGRDSSWLAVNRGNKINAVGTATSPIIFTSRQNIEGSNNDSSSSQWGGIVLLGRAQITDCEATGATPGTAACYRRTEGAPTDAFYGGTTNTDSSGELKYVQIRYSGFLLSANNELQGLTPSGVGSNTTMEYIQVHNSSDDGIEFFGGHPVAKRLVVTGAEDDSLDIDTGAKGFLQYVIVVQRSEAGKADSLIEGDSDNVNDGHTPRTDLRLANFTFVTNAVAGNGAAIMLRGGMDATLVNGVVVSPNQSCLQLRNAKTIAAADAADDNLGPPVFHSVVMQCATNPFASHASVTAAQTESIFNAGTNVNATFTASLTSLFVNGANETGVTAFDPSTLGTHFDKTDYIGAVKDANDTWYRGWTCDSGFANFGSNAACTSLPTT